jgi:hypothetical protein
MIGILIASGVLECFDYTAIFNIRQMAEKIRAAP